MSRANNAVSFDDIITAGEFGLELRDGCAATDNNQIAGREMRLLPMKSLARKKTKIQAD